jgi:hypothetical protein
MRSHAVAMASCFGKARTQRSLGADHGVGALEAIALNSYQLSAARPNSESDRLLVLAGFAHSVASSLARDIHLAPVSQPWGSLCAAKRQKAPMMCTYLECLGPTVVQMMLAVRLDVFSVQHPPN